MRTIKFRAWSKHRKKMDNWDYLLYYPNYLRDLLEWAGIIRRENFKEENGKCVIKKDKIIMQYTGLKDRNGVEIYSGDIIKFMEYDGNGEYEKAEVNWYEYAWKAGTYFLHEICQIRVIGNVYQDKHLLD